MGTSCAVADVQGDKATVWSPTQSAYPTRSSVAMLLGLQADNVRVIFTRGAGCYGINGADTVSYDAALLSQAVGKPVRVQLSRQGRNGVGELRLRRTSIDQRAGLDARRRRSSRGTTRRGSPSLGGRPGYDQPGNVDHRACWPASSRRRSRRARPPNRPAIPTTAATPRRPTSPAASAAKRGGAGTIASERVLTHTVASPFFTGPLRSPSRLQNTFAHESFIDEIAARVKADPVAYRLRHLSDPRLKEVVSAAAKARELAGASVAAAGRGARPASRRAAASRASRTKATTATSRWSPRSTSIRRPAIAARSGSSSRRTAGRSRIPTACATRSKAARCRA